MTGESLNIAHYFLDARIEEGRGDRVALHTRARRWTYREVQARANRYANALSAAVLAVRADLGLAIACPDLTTKPWALRLGEEFRSGACHAGRFETSIVLAERPDLVREPIRRDLPANPASLSRAIREGKTSFEEAGGPRAYFGWPAEASAEEGRTLIDALGAILDQAVQAERAADVGQPW
jgi:creatinine amidohydrolase